MKIKNLKKERKRSQAALEYLMSWGWVLIIIVAVIIVLFSFGVFRVPSAPTIISGFQGITMQAAQANSTMMVVKITNNYNQFINITGITINVNGNTYTAYSCLDSIISTGQSTLCRVPVSIPTSSYLSKIQISFTPYKSSIYEVSNGTVSSTLVSGPIPINNQFTYFVEKGLPYGSVFTVNYNTSTNSTTVSSVKNNVSFNLPFGNYYFSVPSVAYQGCISTPSPSSGTHSTGVGEIIQFTSNCTTTFSETGLPLSSDQTWQVTYNGTTKSNSTGLSIYIHTNNTKSTQVSYTATAKSDTLSCVSYSTPSIRLGGSYTFSAWNCTTTFSETGLPSSQQWHVSSYDGSSSSAVNTGSTASVLQTDITTVSSYTASAVSNNIDCYSNPDITAEQGSSGNTFTTWTCITTFSETGLPLSSGQTWQVTYNGTTTSNVATGTSIPITTNNVKNAQVFYTATAKSDTLSCVSYSTPPIDLGASYTFSAWNCTTTFSSGLPSPYNSYNWRITYTGIQSPYNPTTSSISIETTGITTVSYEAITQGNIENLACDYNATSVGYEEGSANTLNNNDWDCVTAFTQTGLQSTQEVWAVVFNNAENVAANPLTFNNIPGIYPVFVPKDLLNGVSEKFIQTNSPTSLLAGSSASVSYSTNGVTPPSGIIYYVPITISNAQGSATPNGFQQRVIINAPNFGYYEASNMQNVEFFYSNGQVIPSWLEMGNNSYSKTVYWLKLNSIGASSSEVIYMGFAAPSTNLFNGNTVGEAPQLSPTYAEYDNGGNIFNIYANGNTKSSDFTTAEESSGSITQSTGVNYPGSYSGSINALYDTGAYFPVELAGYPNTVYNASSLSNGPAIVEANFNISTAEGSDNGVIGLGNLSYIPSDPACSGNSCSGQNSPPVWAIGTQSGGQSTDCGSGGCYLLFQDYDYGQYLTVSCSFNAKTGRICTYSNNGKYSQGNNELGSANGNWNYAELRYDGSSTYYSYVGGLPQYVNSGTGDSASVNTGFTFSGSNLYVTMVSWTSLGSAYAYKVYYNWMFARDYPPNGAMPSISFGSLEAAGVNVNSGNSGTYSKYFTWNGGGADAYYYASGGATSENYYLTNYAGASYVSGSTASYCPQLDSTLTSLSTGIYSISITTDGGGYAYCGDTMAELT